MPLAAEFPLKPDLLSYWVYELVVEGWSDLAVKVDNTQLPLLLECSQESRKLASHGWSCPFRSMPHVCTFNSTEVSLERYCPLLVVSLRHSDNLAGGRCLLWVQVLQLGRPRRKLIPPCIVKSKSGGMLLERAYNVVEVISENSTGYGRVRLPQAWASCRDYQVMATPISSLPCFSPLPSTSAIIIYLSFP